MTLVNIDLRNQGYEAGPDDRVIFYSLLVREGDFGTISTAPVEVRLTDGKATIDLAPGPVGVQIIAGQVADTRVKIGEVPPSGPTTLNAVMMVTPAYTPALQAQFLKSIQDAQAQALGRIDGEVAVAIDAEVGEFKDISVEALSRAKSAEVVAGVADSKSGAATSTASSAVSTANNAVTRVVALEAMSELSPESPVDGQTANLISQTETLTRGALDHAFGDRADPATHRVVYVTSDGSDSNTGGSWGDALRTIGAAYAALGETRGTIEIGAGIFEVDNLTLKTRVRMIGRGISSTTLQSPSGKTLFNVNSAVTEVNFEHIRFHPRSGHGFDCAIRSSISRSQWRNVEWLLEPNFSAFHMPDGEWIENTISDFHIQHRINATVPAIKLWSSINSVNVNTFENGRFTFSGFEPSIDIRSLGNTWVYDNIIRRINFEVTAGGAARILGGMNTVFESCVVYDLQKVGLNPTGELNAHSFYIGKGQSGLASQFTTFRNVGRRGSHTGALADGTRAFDIYLEPDGADTTMMEHCYAAGGHMNLAWNLNRGTYVGRTHHNTLPRDGSDDRVTYFDPVRGARVFRIASMNAATILPADTHLGATLLDSATGIVYMAYGGKWKPINQLSEVESVAPAGPIVGRVAVRGDGGVVLGYVPVYGNSS